MTDTKPDRRGPPALSSPVEDDKPRALRVWNVAYYDCPSHESHRDCSPPDHITAEFARIRAEAVAAEREACAQVADTFRGKDYPECAEHIADDIRARGPAPAQQPEEGER